MFPRVSREHLTGDVAHEEAPFLVDHEKRSEMSAGDARTRPSLAGRHRLSSFNIVLLILLFLSNVAWWASLNHRGAQEPITSCVRPQLVWSPGTAAIEYDRVVLNRSIESENVFAGKRTKAMDEAWAELIKPMAIKISKKEIERLGETSISFRDGSGYLAEMAVFHELHCVKHLREHLTMDFRNMTEFELDFERGHIDHCLEYFREAAMCRGDPTLAFFTWDAGIPKSKRDTTNECVKWDKLRAFAESRMVDVSDYSILNQDG
ncbi:hypothetical protein HBH98_051100 [Parastagonospora nodorum]|nr:hypothetical protein HBH98_051100 [Parastagonospora nodorum]KAH4380020.1 hypothetical protein HBH97_090730 [Parastagonospora nodorum]KAH4424694.1 hypothetical protein HBH99_038690 [Parastagonospora nodorum]KAH5136387.1 hypothetical protein HBH70_118240 [Parastagonospora nodorum]KAH5306302.1 hypothetical protein HBI12_164170 [Parastagonospora nodorum]